MPITTAAASNAQSIVRDAAELKQVLRASISYIQCVHHRL
jgi:hypothetical protein